jgi:hypothetical protein
LPEDEFLRHFYFQAIDQMTTEIQPEDTRFEIRPSTIPQAGRGLFARVDLPVGERLEICGVLIVPDSITDQCTGWADAYKIRFSNTLILPTGFAAIVNHSDRPNVMKREIHGKYFFEVSITIQKGEELFFKYSDYAVDRFIALK